MQHIPRFPQCFINMYSRTNLDQFSAMSSLCHKKNKKRTNQCSTIDILGNIWSVYSNLSPRESCVFKISFSTVQGLVRKYYKYESKQRQTVFLIRSYTFQVPGINTFVIESDPLWPNFHQWFEYGSRCRSWHLVTVYINDAKLESDRWKHIQNADLTTGFM